jgi:hypothetical protein
MATTMTTQGKFRSWHKFGILVVIAIGLLLAASYTGNQYLDWGAGGIFIISMWYGILSVLRLMEKVSNR